MTTDTTHTTEEQPIAIPPELQPRIAKSRVARKRLYRWVVASSALALILSVFAILEVVQQTEQLTQRTNGLNQNIQNLDKKLIDGKQPLALMQQQIAAQTQELATQAQHLQLTTNGMREILAHQTMHRQAWTLDEVRYLLQQAVFTLKFSHSVPAAQHLLQLVNARLLSLGNPEVQALQSNVSQALEQLKAIPEVDRAHILAELDTVGQQLAAVPIKVPQLEKQTQNPTEIHKESKSNLPQWRLVLNQSLQALHEIVIIKQQQVPIEPMLSEQSYFYLLEQLQFRVQQAEWAVIKTNNQLYQKSLQQIVSLLQSYFETNATRTQAVLTQLKTLQQIDIEPKLPELTPLVYQAEKLLPSLGPESNIPPASPTISGKPANKPEPVLVPKSSRLAPQNLKQAAAGQSFSVNTFLSQEWLKSVATLLPSSINASATQMRPLFQDKQPSQQNK